MQRETFDLSDARWASLDADLVTISESVNPVLKSSLPEDFAFVCDTPHFTIFRSDGTVYLFHRFAPEHVDNDLSEYVAAELVRPGCVGIRDTFERCFSGIVTSSAGTPEEAWDTFYRNTLSRLERVASGDYPADDYGPVSVFGRIYTHAASLIAGDTLLDVGTCFGFFPLLMERTGRRFRTTALDISEPILDLARRRTRSVRFVHGDALGLDFADDSFDTVTSLHVLEHLSEGDVRLALGEMCRVARRRVVVAVPLEEEPDGAFDHLRGFSPEDLIRIAEETGWECRFHHYLGGWVVLTPRG